MTTYHLEQTRHKLTAIADFERAHHQAWWSYLWAKVRGRDNQLLSFAEFEPYLPQQRLYKGVQDIPLSQILGSVNRQTEFDRYFHPLRADIETRWVNIRLLAQTAGWPPIQVYQVGNIYFVEDGHHRVSVGRYLQNRVIEAMVWVYPVQAQFETHASRQVMLTQLSPSRLGQTTSWAAECCL